MEKYTDKYHPQYIPGTYSIYSSALIRHQHHLAIRRYKYLLQDLEDKDKSRIGDESTNPFINKKLMSKKHYQLSNKYNYTYSSKRKFKDIPDLKTKFGIILQPQPTNSPNDPLNWSTKRKFLHFFLILSVTALMAGLSNDASAPTDSISKLTGISYNTLNNIAGIMFLMTALSAWFYSPFDFLLGRKSVILFGLIFALFGSIWYAKMEYNGDAYGSQILIGFGAGSIAAHAQLCLASIFYRHQLGAVITIYNLAFSLGTYLGPLVANYISEKRTFRWVGWSGSIASAILLVLTIFLFEEDSFDYLKFNNNKTDDLTLNLSLIQNNLLSNDESNDLILLGYNDEPKNYWERIILFTLPKNEKYHNIKNFLFHYFKLLIIPIKCMLFPPVVYAGCMCGLQNAILSFYLTTEDTLSTEEFNFSTSDIALMNIPCIIGSIIGCLYAGSMTDYFILWMARKRNGIVESEYRLYFAFLSGSIGAAGLLMFGLGISRVLNWRVIYVGLGFISYMFSSSNNIAMLYVMDTYRELILETLVCVAFINNIIGCIFTFACSPWLDASGTENTYIALATITLGIMYASGLFIYWGKSWRKMTHEMYVRLVEIKNDH
jgi:MFS family permease